jgi:hypothetical protein
MGAFAFMSQKVETVAPKLERRIRKEIGSGAPLNYTIENGEAHAASVGTLLGGVGAALAHKERGAPFLFRLNFQQPPPRPASLRLSVARQGFGSYVASFLYSTQLRKPIAGEVSPRSISLCCETSTGAARMPRSSSSASEFLCASRSCRCWPVGVGAEETLRQVARPVVTDDLVGAAPARAVEPRAGAVAVLRTQLARADRRGRLRHTHQRSVPDFDLVAGALETAPAPRDDSRAPAALKCFLRIVLSG